MAVFPPASELAELLASTTPGAMALDPDNARAKRPYGQSPIVPGRRPAVLVVDFQAAFTDAEHPLGGSPIINAAVDRTAELLERARALDVPIFQCVVEWSDLDVGLWGVKMPSLRDVTPGSRWAANDPRVTHPDHIEIVKKAPSFFFGTHLQAMLTQRGVDTLIVTGCVTSGCVRATVVDGFSYGYPTLIPYDCVGDQGQDIHDNNLRDLHWRYAEVTVAETVERYLDLVAQAAAAPVA